MKPFFRFALIGDPVDHSMSPNLHQEAFRISGLDGEYRALRTDRQGLARVVADLHSGRLNGVNVTMPLKGVAFEVCESTTPLAASAGSVNTLRIRQNRLEGHTTDAVVFESLFAGQDSKTPLLILGAGGSARAALAARGNRAAWVSARDPARRAELADEMAIEGALEWGEGLDGALVVNATPLGMSGERLPQPPLGSASAIIDLPYSSQPTPAQVSAQERGVPYVGGLEFLARQAAASFEWWTGVSVDSNSLMAVLRNV